MTAVARRARVRPAETADAAAIVQLVRDLAVYERHPVSVVKLTAADVRRDAFGALPRFEVLLAEWDGEIEGFALFFHNYSTWEARPGLYLEDLFVREAARGHGLGRLLLIEIGALAEARGCGRIDLNVLDWNPTRAFYDRLGFKDLVDWRPYRMDRGAIAALAAARRS